ncbi:MAG TPA: pentapeptide repeat-containing protein [Geminicoccaceae bacterium]
MPRPRATLRRRLARPPTPPPGAQPSDRARGAKLKGAHLELAWAIEADLSGADLSGANLFQAQMPRVRLDCADLSGARLLANLDGASLRGARLTAVDGAPDMRNQSMGQMRASLRGAVLEGADLTGAELSRADLEFAKLAGAVLDRADLTRALLGGADFTGASVAGLDVTDADVSAAIFRRLTGKERLHGLDAARNRDRAFTD